MNNLIYCQKLKREEPALEYAPYPGQMGERILENISATAWQQWLERQTMLINEYRLTLIDPQAKTFLKEQMEKFLFEDEDIKPEGFKPQE